MEDRGGLVWLWLGVNLCLTEANRSRYRGGPMGGWHARGRTCVRGMPKKPRVEEEVDPQEPPAV